MQFAERVKRMSDIELIRIVESEPEEGYEPDVIELAAQELSERNIDTAEVDYMTDDVRQEQIQKSNRASAQLGALGKIIFMLFAPFATIYLIVAASVMSADGYENKAKDAWRFIFYGWGLYLVIILLLIVFG